MKNIFIALFLLIGNLAAATTYYISPNGSDSNSGTLSSPFFTLNKAWSVVKAGDLIYVRGGVYRFSNRQTLTGKNGTASDTIRVWGYPGERPVFTKSSGYTTSGWPASLIYLDADYTHWKNIEIAYYKQASSALWYGMAVLGSSNNKFERINSHHNGHGMVIRDESSSNLVLNCDFHHNYDPLTGDTYGDADGLEIAYHSPSSTTNTVRGCRFWANSDDGIDMWDNNGKVVVENCWSWRNGYREDGTTKGGDGGGFKFGKTQSAPSEFKRTIKNCVSVYNRTRGYNQNSAEVKHYFYNNIAYKNGTNGWDFYAFNLGNVFRNNISFSNSSSNWSGQYSNSTKDHNSYDASFQPNGPSVSSSDFASLDTTGMSGARRADGSLPSLNFLKLASGSDMIDAGVDVGMAYAGNAPDLGPFESGMGSSLPAPVVQPVAYVSSEVKNASPSQVSLTYSASLSQTKPETSAFEVKVNNTVRSLTTLSISDKNVNLTLSSPVNYGDVVTISYVKPATNPITCLANTVAESISNKSVTNSVAAVPAAYVSSVVENETPNRIDITYSTALAATAPAQTSYTALVNGARRNVQSVTISGSKVSLIIESSVSRNDTVTISYNKPTTNPLQSSNGAVVENITAKAVVNNVQGVATTTPDTTKKPMTIYPNPAHEYITISNLEPSSDEHQLRVYDFAGKLCREIKLENLSSQKIPIDLKPGMYIVQVMSGKIIKHTQKLIVI